MARGVDDDDDDDDDEEEGEEEEEDVDPDPERARRACSAVMVRMLVRRARGVMLEPTCRAKARRTAALRRWWRRVRWEMGRACGETAGDDGGDGEDDEEEEEDADDFDDALRDARTERVVEDPAREIVGRGLVKPGQTKRLGKGGTEASRVAILHSLAHIESWAMDLAWDAIQRFGEARAMPLEFYDDFVELAADEGRHFELLARRLEGYGAAYGDLEAHDGLWQTARETSGSLEARLVVEHAVHEARGLDVLPMTIEKFRKNGDEESAALLEGVVYPEEITHCAAGLRWFKYLHAREGEKRDGGVDADLNVEIEVTESSTVVRAFHDIVRKHFAGVLKPPFNVEARASAGFTPIWYEPLVEKKAAIEA